MLLAFQPSTPSSVVAFVAICLMIMVSFLLAAGTTALSREKAIQIVSALAIGLAVYCVSISFLVLSGIFVTAFIPFGPLFFVATISIAVSLGFTRLGARIAAGVPLAWLVGFQAFRFPLELVLHDWYVTGTIPESMTWTGSNWDIVSGVIALMCCPLVTRWPKLAWLVNILGLVLLVNVGRVAVFSSPVPFGWEVEPKLELIAYFPYVFIVPICVGGAALGHVLLTRRLLTA